MKRLTATASAVVLAFTSACATAPANISAQYISPMQYQSYSCPQIQAELRRVSRQVSTVTGQQQDKANSDLLAMGVGLVLFWPALFFLASGNDKKDELGRLKGEYEALSEANSMKCANYAGEPPAQSAPPAAPAAQPAVATPVAAPAN